MLVVGWPGRNARVSDHGERRHRQHRRADPTHHDVLVSIPVIGVVAHAAAAHAETTADLPDETIPGSATASRSRSVEHGHSWRDVAGAPRGLRGGLGEASAAGPSSVSVGDGGERATDEHAVTFVGGPGWGPGGRSVIWRRA